MVINTILYWLETEINSKKKSLIGIEWNTFVYFPFSIFFKNKILFLFYILYLLIYFKLNTYGLSKAVFEDNDTIILFAIITETILRFYFFPLILYFCIDKSKIIYRKEKFLKIKIKFYKNYLFLFSGVIISLIYIYYDNFIFYLTLFLSIIILIKYQIKTINLVLFLFSFEVLLYINFLGLFVRSENSFGIFYLLFIFFIILLIYIYDKFILKDA